MIHLIVLALGVSAILLAISNLVLNVLCRKLEGAVELTRLQHDRFLELSLALQRTVCTPNEQSAISCVEIRDTLLNPNLPIPVEERMDKMIAEIPEIFDTFDQITELLEQDRSDTNQ